MAYTYKHGDRPVDGYVIQRAVGAGGFGEVYYAVSDGGREVALKYLRDNPQVELRGVGHCMNLKSPHLVSVFDVRKNADGEYFIVMEYCSGPSLRDLLIAEPSGFEPQKAAFFVREIAKGLAYLHDRGIVHRDLKPGNIFYDDGYVKIGDYGLSKFISVSRHSAQTASVGTVHYMAPEIGSGNYSRGVDIYALGVILYEMLLGKVPFEGSSMGEVLMKHLMSQPHVDDLPAPFGRVIRKALEKDPKDRYQTVDEMVEELLSVEDVQKSLAGFSPQSLAGAVRRGTADRAASPMPSPNPAPRGRKILAPGVRINLPAGVADRLGRVARKLEQKIAKLDGKSRGRAVRRGTAAADPPSPFPPAPLSRRPVEVSKRITLSALTAVGLAVIVGLICGNLRTKEEGGVSAGLLTLALPMSVGITRRVLAWLGREAQPAWAQALVRITCSAPLIFLASIPLIDRDNDKGLAVALGLLLVAAFADWGKDVARGVVGEMSIASAIWTGIGAVVATAIASAVVQEAPDDFVLISAFAAVASSIIVQAASWWLQPGRDPSAVWTPGGAPLRKSAEPLETQANRERPLRMPEVPQPFMSSTMPAAPERPYSNTSAPSRTAHPNLRWGVTRAFWGLIGFASMAGVIVLFIVSLSVPRMAYNDLSGLIVGTVGSLCAMIFALSKTSPTRRVGFWRETARPFLCCAALFGIGSTITVIAREWDRFHTDEQVMSIVGLVGSSLTFVLTLLDMALRRRSRIQPFLKEADSGMGLASPASPSAQPEGARV